MKVYAHASRKHNEIVCVATKQYRCTMPFGILDPQPQTQQELNYIRMTGQFVLVDQAVDTTAGHVESYQIDENLEVEVFSLEEPEPLLADEVLVPEAIEDAGLVDGVLPEEEEEGAGTEDLPTEDADQATDTDPSAAAVAKYAQATDQELRDICALFDIKVRKNATRASLIKLLTEVAPE